MFNGGYSWSVLYKIKCWESCLFYIERLQNITTPSSILQNTKRKPSQVQLESQLYEPATGL